MVIIAACVTGHVLGLTGTVPIKGGYSALAHHNEFGELAKIVPDLRPQPLAASLVVAHRRNLALRGRALMTLLRVIKIRFRLAV